MPADTLGPQLQRCLYEDLDIVTKAGAAGFPEMSRHTFRKLHRSRRNVWDAVLT
jgi:hypothetical protein